MDDNGHRLGVVVGAAAWEYPVVAALFVVPIVVAVAVGLAETVFQIVLVAASFLGLVVMVVTVVVTAGTTVVAVVAVVVVLAVVAVETVFAAFGQIDLGQSKMVALAVGAGSGSVGLWLPRKRYSCHLCC